MSLIDFNEEARNQGSLHVAVMDLGGADSKSFFNVFLQALSKLPPIQLKEPKGSLLFLRFLSYENLPVWATEGPNWSEFNPHKQIMGVLGVGRCHDLDNLDNTASGFKIYCGGFERRIYGSRCIMYGRKSELEGGNVESDRQYCLIDAEPSSDDVKLQFVSEVVTELALTMHASLKSRVSQLEDSLSRASVAPLPLLHSPLESKEYFRPDDEPEQR